MNKQGNALMIGIFVMVAVILLVAGGIGFAFLKGGSNSAASLGNQNTPSTGVTACTTPLSTTQTPNFVVNDFDQKGTTLTATSVIYGDLSNPGSIVTTTTPGQAYTGLLNKSGYLGVTVPFSTPCNTANVPVAVSMEAYDSSVSFATYNAGGHTLNAVSANQTIGASGSATVSVELTPSALYKHLAGGPNNKFTVFASATNTTQWDTTKFALSGNTGWGANTPVCTPYSGAAPTTLTGVYVYGWDCTGDFSGMDQAVRTMNLNIGGSAVYSTAGANNSITLTFVPHDYYKNTITGAVSSGAVKNDGSAIQTGQTTAIYVK